ncbi:MULTISPECIES: hypothetical protein [Agrobacterium tumefaciens complex]|uniref:Uncharacterized protein n=1 Tax=Agrobacterium tomkonis CFBP 6623 TaxID=1183432 RepID=A0A1S7PUZ6_9HYPH|nr:MULTISPECIES: hypothetical protein [Agrobacterium tumefaciens complex]QCL88253.1 hypothetical protein CFBP6623_03300 [Agrobacterium tumefaciens]CUX26997.1 hypothetical protein AGR3A_Cc340006 [Agrobacterium tomkonis CFBP 6623]
MAYDEARFFASVRVSIFGGRLRAAQLAGTRTILAGCRKAIAGSFTGRRLADFFGAQREDWEGARAIINGSDRARLGAGHARAFHRALVAARIEPARVR